LIRGEAFPSGKRNVPILGKGGKTGKPRRKGWKKGKETEKVTYRLSKHFLNRLEGCSDFDL